jgi:hypothetical protein
MRVFLHLIVLLLIACVMLITASVVFGHGQPPAPLATGLRLADCDAPCWVGLMPGETEAQAAHDRLGSIFDIPLIPLPVPQQPARFTRETIILPLHGSSGGRSGIPLTVEYGQGVLLDVQMYFDRMHPPALGDILVVYGEPQCIEPQSVILPNGGWTLYYQQDSAYISVTVVSAGDKALRLHSPITYITIGTTQGVNMPTTQLCGESVFGRYTWRGLAPRWAYHVGNT